MEKKSARWSSMGPSLMRVGPRNKAIFEAIRDGKPVPKIPKPRPQYRLAQGKKTDRYVRINGGRTVYRESTVERWHAEARAHAEFKRLLPERRKRKLPPNSRAKRRNRWMERARSAWEHYIGVYLDLHPEARVAELEAVAKGWWPLALYGKAPSEWDLLPPFGPDTEIGFYRAPNAIIEWDWSRPGG